MNWLEAAMFCERVYGVFVCYDEDDRYFICPECGEPILEEDWLDIELDMCPVCEFEWLEEAE